MKRELIHCEEDPRAYCMCCGAPPDVECDEVCKQIREEIEKEK